MPKIKPQTEQQKTLIEMFTEATANNQWSTIDDLLSVTKQNPELENLILKGDSNDRMLKIGIRQLIKQLKNEEGMPVYASIKTEDANGNAVYVYKQETLFDVSDYEQTVDFHSKRVVHHAQMAAYYAKGFQALTGKQAPLPFDPQSILLD
jgi:hypothetical protein